MRILTKDFDSLYEISAFFNLPTELIIDSNKEFFDQGSVLPDEINIPGFSLLPSCFQEEENQGAIRSVERTFQENKQKLWKHTSPAIVGRMEYSPEILERDLAVLKQAYPYASVREIGKSVLGNPIKEIKIGKGNRKIHINASFHANEWITSGVLMELVNAYLIALTNNGGLHGAEAMGAYRSVELSIVPMVNPDGVSLVINGPPKGLEKNLLKMNNGSTDFSGWKANCNGVDLNNQFPANWEIEKGRKEPKSPAARDYPGNKPLSEPEVAAMAKLVRESQFDMVIAFHTQGEEFYWGYGGREPGDSEKLAAIFSKSSGYKAVRSIDSHAGFKDWFIQEFGKPGFTIELGKGINPIPLSQYNKIYNQIKGIFISALNWR
ncbi:peptidase M14 [Neobacillus notoginsengisoli]|uniref:Peptidase M14 n=1 Tax=Neobacillus notoginsengisoli TaxID=1578198 RepID=A0A417YUT1_9BACI|nr:M14 family metallocarboxypeptidase [Neobacillus notoginsengisoli]RHW41067.1 peptidase M14 [Neobacillus notoginsengisoli]